MPPVRRAARRRLVRDLRPHQGSDPSERDLQSLRRSRMKWFKRVLLGVVVFFAVAAGGLGIFACVEIRRYDASMEKVYDVPPMAFTLSTDQAVLERGKHLADSVAPCT